MIKQRITVLKQISFSEKLIYLYIALVPFMRVPNFPFIGQKIQYSDLVFLLLFCIWLIKLFKGKRRFIDVPLQYPLGAMLVAMLFSFIHSADWAKSSLEYAGILYLAGLYFLFCQLIDTNRMWWRLVKCWCIVSVLIAVSGITAYLFSCIAGYNCFLMTSHDLGNVNKELVWRLVSVFRHPGMLTLYLHASIVFGLILVAKNKDGRRYYLGYVIVALCFIAALLTKTRCNAGIAITIFLVVASLDIKNIYFSILRYISFIYALAFMAIAIVLTVWWVFPVHLQIDQKRQVVLLELNAVKQPYFIHHVAELKIIRDFPLVGVGLGMYNQRQASYIRWGDLEKPYQQIFPGLKEENESVYRRSDPHSLYFGMGAETGLLGLGAMLIFFLLLARLFYRKIKESADKQNRYICVVFLAGLAGFLFNGLYLDMLTVRSFWLMFAMGAAYKD